MPDAGSSDEDFKLAKHSIFYDLVVPMTGNLIKSSGNLKDFKIENFSPGRKWLYAPGEGWVESFVGGKAKNQDVIVMRLKCGLHIKITIITNKFERFGTTVLEHMVRDKIYAQGECLVEYHEKPKSPPRSILPMLVDAATLSILDLHPISIATHRLPEELQLFGGRNPLIRLIFRGERHASLDTYLRLGFAVSRRYGVWRPGEVKLDTAGWRPYG